LNPLLMTDREYVKMGFGTPMLKSSALAKKERKGVPFFLSQCDVLNDLKKLGDPMILNFFEFPWNFSTSFPRTPGPSSNMNHDETAKEAALVKDNEVQRGKTHGGNEIHGAPGLVLNGVMGPL